jgi:hypothetical protein
MSSVEKPYTSRDKWIISLMAGLMFLILASPIMFIIVNKITKIIGLRVSDDHGHPNIFGLLLMTCIYIVWTRIMMK